ncbi:MAG: HAD family hydrolase [Candidatus Binatia bacterium]
MDRLLLFDIDGTLLHVAEEIAFARAFAEHCGAPVDLSFSPDMVLSDDGYVRGVLRRAALPHADAHVDAALARFVHHLHLGLASAELAVRPVAGAVEFVGGLRDAVALATGCVEGSARAKLGVIGLAARFPCGGFSHREQARWEILERALHAAAAHYGRPFDRRAAVYFGDGVWDVAAAAAVGIGFVGINEHPDGRARLTAAGAGPVFADYSDPVAIRTALARL